MRSFVIRLEENSTSKEWSEITKITGEKYNWKIDYFSGIDGRLTTLEEHGLFVNPRYKKGLRLFRNPGVVGCFLSHYYLWKKCLELNESVCILEHDVEIISTMPYIDFDHILKLVRGPVTKQMYLGTWWASGAAYCVTTEGAKKLVNFAHKIGVMPADTMLNTGIASVQFFDKQVVRVIKKNYSFTKNYY